ncbi:MAG: hypothetical protein BAJALOKI3v1_50009 [Promethearchaeota archaeon]|nr:MAG: hypothetical protein BAJALOKI3v1_50009 [Candidatus Lokiarchaeota archaeon]
MIWFTSDTHFGHKNTIKFCRSRNCFMTSEETELWNQSGKDISTPISSQSIHNMNKTIIDNINNCVKYDDILFILGDFCFPSSKCKIYTNQINCKDIRLVLGNHDNLSQIKPLFDLHPAFTIVYNPIQIFIHKYEENMVLDIYNISYNNKIKSRFYKNIKNWQGFYLSHYPHISWPRSDRGNIHLHGHSHGNLEEWKKEHMPDNHRNIIDVGVDVQNLKPISYNEIKDRQQ